MRIRSLSETGFENCTALLTKFGYVLYSYVVRDGSLDEKSRIGPDYFEGDLEAVRKTVQGTGFTVKNGVFDAYFVHDETLRQDQWRGIFSLERLDSARRAMAKGLV